MKTSFTRFRAGRFLAALATLALVPVAQAALREWDGDAPMDNNWNTSANWVGNILPNPGDDLLFRSATRHPQNNNNFAPGTTFNSIQFPGGGGPGYNISGNSIALNAGIQIENNSGDPSQHTVNNPLLLNSNQTFSIHNPSGLFFLTGTLNLNGRDLTFDITLASQAQSQGAIGGAGTLLKNGDGTLTLVANNTYTGATTVNGGTLQINGSQPASPVFLNAGTLKGIGTVGTISSVGSGGSILLSPGGSPGILTCSNVALNLSTTFAVELNGPTPGSGYDQLRVNGSISLGLAGLLVTLGFTPAVGASFIIMTNDGVDAVMGTFNGLPEGSILIPVLSTNEFRLSYAGGDGNDVVLTRVPTGTAAAPRLTVQRATPNAVRFLWSTNPPGFNLESNTNLATTNWVSASPPPLLAGTNNVVTNTAAGPQKFYRLKQ